MKVGVDLGTSSIVLVVLDRDNRPIAWEMEEASVIRDGLVVDYSGAVTIVHRLKEALEQTIKVNLTSSAIAVPPGTGERDSATHRYVAEAAGLKVSNVLDEPTAANSVLRMKDGAIVDIGGGTTGISIISDGKVLGVFDEPTGGIHVSLVIAGNRGISLQEAEVIKRDPSRSKEVLTMVTPVIQKMGYIVASSIKGFPVDCLTLVGGTCSLQGLDAIVSKETGIPAFTPCHPFLVTPLGIAINCEGSESKWTKNT